MKSMNWVARLGVLAVMAIFVSNVHAAINAPTNIADCVLWLDASDASTITESSGYVSQWSDKSSSGAGYSQGTGDNQPQTGAASQNSKNVLTFDGGDWLGSSSTVLTGGDEDLLTYVVVWRPHVTSGGQVVFEQGGTGTVGERVSLLAVDGAYGFNGEGNDKHDLVSFSANAWRLSVMVLDGTDGNNVHIFDNGDDLVTGHISKNTENLSGDDGIRVCAKVADNGENLDGDIAEVIVYDHALKNSDIDELEYYLDQKWGLGLGVGSVPDAQVEYDFEDSDYWGLGGVEHDGWHVF